MKPLKKRKLKSRTTLLRYRKALKSIASNEAVVSGVAVRLQRIAQRALNPEPSSEEIYRA